MQHCNVSERNFIIESIFAMQYWWWLNRKLAFHLLTPFFGIQQQQRIAPPYPENRGANEKNKTNGIKMGMTGAADGDDHGWQLQPECKHGWTGHGQAITMARHSGQPDDDGMGRRSRKAVSASAHSNDAAADNSSSSRQRTHNSGNYNQ